jgi:hypothetical protein
VTLLQRAAEVANLAGRYDSAIVLAAWRSTGSTRTAIR